MSSQRAMLLTTKPWSLKNGDASSTGTMLFRRDSIVRAWETELHFDMCRISFPTCSISYEYWGGSSGADQVVHRGDLSSNSFSVWWVRQQRLVAAFTMNRPDEERNLAPKWIESGQRVSHIKLSDVSQPTATASVSPAA